jgi:hypothetical protein
MRAERPIDGRGDSPAVLALPSQPEPRESPPGPSWGPLEAPTHVTLLTNPKSVSKRTSGRFDILANDRLVALGKWALVRAVKQYA